MENLKEQSESKNEQTSLNPDSSTSGKTENKSEDNAKRKDAKQQGVISMALTKISDSKNYGATNNPKTEPDQGKVKQQQATSEELIKASDKKNYGADLKNPKTEQNQGKSKLKKVTAEEVAEYKDEEADKSAAEKKGDAIDGVS